MLALGGGAPKVRSAVVAGSFLSTRLHYDVAGQVWFEKELPDGWVAAYRLLPQLGRPVAAEARLYPGRIRGGRVGEADASADVPPGGITTSLLRLPVERHLKEAQEEWMRPPTADQYVRPESARYTDWDVPALWGFAAYLHPRPSPAGRPRRSEVDYAIFAALYVAAVEENPDSPYKSMATNLAAREHDHSDRVASHYTVSSLRNIVTKAREKGYLTSAGSGRVGGELTPLARDALAAFAADSG